MSYVNDSLFPALSDVAVTPRCLGSGPRAGTTLKLSYGLNVAATLTFTLQRRTGTRSAAVSAIMRPRRDRHTARGA